MVLHRFISARFPRNPKGSTAVKMAQQRAQQARRAAAAAAGGQQQPPALPAPPAQHQQQQQQGGMHVASAAEGLRGRVLRGLSVLSLRRGAGAGGTVAFDQSSGGKMGAASSLSGSRPTAALNGAGPHGGAAEPGSSNDGSNGARPAADGGKDKKKRAMSMKDAFAFLKSSPQIRCLAVMALAQVGRPSHCLLFVVPPSLLLLLSWCCSFLAGAGAAAVFGAVKGGQERQGGMARTAGRRAAWAPVPPLRRCAGGGWGRRSRGPAYTAALSCDSLPFTTSQP